MGMSAPTARCETRMEEMSVSALLVHSTRLSCVRIVGTAFSLTFLTAVVSVCVWTLGPVRLFANPRTVARHAPLSTRFPRQEYWSGLPCPPPWDLLTQGLNSGLLHCRQVLYHLSHQGGPSASGFY